jgi:hypothetical protein
MPTISPVSSILAHKSVNFAGLRNTRMGKFSDEKYKGAADHWRDKVVPGAELWTCGWEVNRTIHGKLLFILTIHLKSSQWAF